MLLFFDTETTGLPKNWKAPVTDLDNWPRLVQLAYLVYDFDGNLIHSCNEIIKPDGFTIPTEASNVHGITTEMASQRGTDINDVFELFLIHLKKSKMIVAHNMAFDEKIIGSELIRLGKENFIDAKEKVCTMLKTVDLCKIEGPYGYKWPKLHELHWYLFKHDFEGAHDALADIQATAKCFWELLNTNKINCDYINKRKVLRARIKNLLNSKYNKTINDESIPFFVLFESNPEFTILLLSLHYPFNTNEIDRFWNVLKKGDAHYSYFMIDTDTVYQPKLGLCFNKNISWNTELRKKWSVGFWDPFLGSLFGTGLQDDVSMEEEIKLSKIIPLDLKSEIEIRNDEIIDCWLAIFYDPEKEFEPPYTVDMNQVIEVYEKLDFPVFKYFFENKRDIVICNESIWDNTLKQIFTKERVKKFLNNQLDNLTKSKSDLLDSDEKINIKSDIETAISLKMSILIQYKNSKNELTKRMVSDINYSPLVLEKDVLDYYHIDNSFISGKCSVRNEIRTFKIERIIKLELIDNNAYEDDLPF